jgi:phosphate transport system protein
VTRTIDPGLAELRALVSRMGERARAILAKSLHAVRHHSRSLALEVQRDDLEIDRLDVAIDQAVLALLATQTPMAQDLREVVAIKGIASDLERIGDLARDIARCAERLADAPAAEIPGDLSVLADESSALLAEALECVASLDSSRARAVLRADDRIDREEADLIRSAIAEIQRRPARGSQEVDFIFIAKSLERVADHATNIAEDVVLVAEARNVKHEAKLAG